MTRTLRRLLTRLRREDGSVTIEFVLLFPVFIGFFASAFEAGLMTVRHVMLERATDVVIRDMRLGNINPLTHDDLKATICNAAGVIPNCDQALHIELELISKENWTYRTGQIQCIDRDENIVPVLNFTPGASNQMMLVTVCAVVEPMVPITGFGLGLPRVNSTDYALIAMSAFVNEPS